MPLVTVVVFILFCLTLAFMFYAVALTVYAYLELDEFVTHGFDGKFKKRLKKALEKYLKLSNAAIGKAAKSLSSSDA